jgi:hypothetical protein
MVKFLKRLLDKRRGYRDVSDHVVKILGTEIKSQNYARGADDYSHMFRPF